MNNNGTHILDRSDINYQIPCGTCNDEGMTLCTSHKTILNGDDACFECDGFDGPEKVMCACM